MYSPLCLCADLPVLKLNTKIVILMHHRERKLVTNTATLACLALTNSEIRLRGLKDEPLLTAGLVSERQSAAILYPTEDAIELTEEAALTLPRPLTLIVPDGSWRQASKVANRETGLKGLPRLKLSSGPPSGYRLRHSPHEENLCTFEAIARALGVLEGKEVQVQLEELFLKMVERRLWSRGRLKPSEAVTGIPEGAILASHIAGRAGNRTDQA